MCNDFDSTVHFSIEASNFSFAFECFKWISEDTYLSLSFNLYTRRQAAYRKYDDKVFNIFYTLMEMYGICHQVFSYGYIKIPLCLAGI